MGTQAMGSQGSGEQQSQFQNLARQGSLYNLTLNEVQSQLGEPLHSMNLDELLRNVLPGEGDQMLLDLETLSSEFTPSSGLQRQGSVTLSMALSKKTVDEIWRDIQQDGHSKVSTERAPAQERQPTFGEITLEDFLVKAGVFADESDKDKNIGMANVGPSGSSDPVVAEPGYAQGVHWLQPFQPIPSLPPQPQQPQQNIMGAYMSSHVVPQPPGVVVNNILDSGFSDGQMSSYPMMGTLSDTQTPGRKRVAPGDVVEKTVERRQKRMIKNRESAARSRARKQAYTNELENKVTRLEKENERLKKQKELDKIIHAAPQPEPKFQSRRTKSSPT